MQIGLVEEIAALRRIVVRGQGHEGLRGIRRAGDEVLITPVIVAVERVVADRERTEIMFDRRRGAVDQRANVTLVGIAVVGADIDVRGPPVE